jgi:hypothetical protein
VLWYRAGAPLNFYVGLRKYMQHLGRKKLNIFELQIAKISLLQDLSLHPYSAKSLPAYYFFRIYSDPMYYYQIMLYLYLILKAGN